MFHYLNVIAAGDLFAILRVPFPLPKWRSIVKAMTPVMQSHKLKQKDIHMLEGLLPFPNDTKAWTTEDFEFAERLDAAFSGDKDKLQKFWLYDWDGDGFELIRKPVA